MKSRTSMLAVVLLVAISAMQNHASAQSIWKEPKHTTWKTATGAEQYTRLLWQAVRKKDWLAVESHIASNFVYMDGAGTKDKQEYLEYLKNLTLSNGSVSQANVTASGIDSIVTYVLVVTPANGEAQSWRLMAIWQQQKSGWVLIALAKTRFEAGTGQSPS